MATDFQLESVHDILDHAVFIRSQPKHKSQNDLLEILNEILVKKYEKRLDQCGAKETKYWIYVDDVLASGGTWEREITATINRFGETEFRDSEIKIISCFVVLHDWGRRNREIALTKYKKLITKPRLLFYTVNKVGNNPDLNFPNNDNPTFDHIYPLKSDNGVEFLEFIEKAFELEYPMKFEKYAFRNPEYPKKEETFSSPENRNRFEEIILDKGIEIIDNIENLNAKGIRPLGMTSPHYKTLGTGSHTFTWRNISNTCPLVYWWETGGWYPLFPVKNRGM
jgi:hypothetical protein